MLKSFDSTQPRSYTTPLRRRCEVSFSCFGKLVKEYLEKHRTRMNHRNPVAPAPAGEAGPGRGPIGATRRPRMDVSELSQIFDPRPARHCVSIDHGTEGHRRVSGSFTLRVDRAKRVQDAKGRIVFLGWTRIFGDGYFPAEAPSHSE